MAHKVTILGVKISQVSSNNALRAVTRVLSSEKYSRPLFIATPNPEMLVLAHQDSKFRHILNSADLAIPDGIGLVLASKFLNLRTSPHPSPGRRGIKGEVIAGRISGVDFMLDLCKVAARKGYTVGLLGGREGVAKKTAEVLKKKFSEIKINFSLGEPQPQGSAAGATRPLGFCDLLFVAFGAPKQEEFIHNLISQPQGLNKAPKMAKPLGLRFKVAMGVGGSFDIISGRIKRAPGWMRVVGLEWLWRLMMEPGRIKRIITATIIFPLLVVKTSVKAKI